MQEIIEPIFTKCECTTSNSSPRGKIDTRSLRRCFEKFALSPYFRLPFYLRRNQRVYASMGSCEARNCFTYEQHFSKLFWPNFQPLKHSLAAGLKRLLSLRFALSLFSFAKWRERWKEKRWNCGARERERDYSAAILSQNAPQNAQSQSSSFQMPNLLNGPELCFNDALKNALWNGLQDE